MVVSSWRRGLGFYHEAREKKAFTNISKAENKIRETLTQEIEIREERERVWVQRKRDKKGRAEHKIRLIIFS